MNNMNENFTIIDELDGIKILKKIEFCHKAISGDANIITRISSRKLVKKLIQTNELDALQEVYISVKFKSSNIEVIDDLMRQKLLYPYVAPYMMYSALDNDADWLYNDFSRTVRSIYNALMKQKHKDLLKNNSEKIQHALVLTLNLKEWRDFLNFRIFEYSINDEVLAETRSILIELMWQFVKEIPIIFNDMARKVILDKIRFENKEKIENFVKLVQDKASRNKLVLLTDYIDSSGLTINAIFKDFYNDCSNYHIAYGKVAALVDMMTDLYLSKETVLQDLKFVNYMDLQEI